MRVIHIYQSLTLIGCDSHQKATAASCFLGFGEGDGFENGEKTQPTTKICIQTVLIFKHQKESVKTVGHCASCTEPASFS